MARMEDSSRLRGVQASALLRRLLGREPHVMSDQDILDLYFEAPSKSLLERIKRHRFKYVSARMPLEDRYKKLLETGPCRRYEPRDLNRITRVAAIRPLMQALERESHRRELVLQGVACSLGKWIDIPESMDGPALSVKPIWRFISPTVSDAPVSPVFDLTRGGLSMSEQGLMSVHEMYGEAANARKRAQPAERALIFPAVVAYDRAMVHVDPLQLQSAKGDGVSALQSRTLTLPFGRAARERAVLGLYVVDFPRYILPRT